MELAWSKMTEKEKKRWLELRAEVDPTPGAQTNKMQSTDPE